MNYQINEYMRFCNENKNFESEDKQVESMDNVDRLNGFSSQYISLVDNLQKLAQLRENLNKANDELRKSESEKIAYFHSTSEITPSAQFESLIQNNKQNVSEIQEQISNIEKTLKNQIQQIEEDIKQFKETGGKKDAEFVRNENNSKAEKIVPEFEESQGHETLKENYTPEIADIMSYQVDKTIDLNLEAFEVCDKLINDMKTTGKVELEEHSKKATAIQGKSELLDRITDEYTRESSPVVKLTSKSLGNDKEYIAKAYEKFSDLVEGKSSDIYSLNYIETGHVEELRGEIKPKLGLKIKNAIRGLLGKPQLLPEISRDYGQHDREKAMASIYNQAFDYLKDNNLVPESTQNSKEQTEFDKSLKVELPQKTNDYEKSAEEKSKAKVSDLVLNENNTQEQDNGAR